MDSIDIAGADHTKTVVREEIRPINDRPGVKTHGADVPTVLGLPSQVCEYSFDAFLYLFHVN